MDAWFAGGVRLSCGEVGSACLRGIRQPSAFRRSPPIYGKLRMEPGLNSQPSASTVPAASSAPGRLPRRLRGKPQPLGDTHRLHAGIRWLRKLRRLSPTVWDGMAKRWPATVSLRPSALDRRIFAHSTTGCGGEIYVDRLLSCARVPVSHAGDGTWHSLKMASPTSWIELSIHMWLPRTAPA